LAVLDFLTEVTQMTKTCSVIAALLLCGTQVPAATLYGNAFTDPSQIVGSIDPATGAMKPIAALPGVKISYWGVSAFDPFTPAYYFCGFDTSLTFRLYSVNIRTGAVAVGGPLPTSLSAMQFDPLTRAIYATVYDFPNQTVIVGRVDAGTGAVTPIATVATQSFGSPIGISALDSLKRRYYLYAGTQAGMYLFAVNLATGAVTASSSAVGPTWGMQFDPLTRTLYGTTLSGPYPNMTVGLGTIDTSTGAVTPIVAVATGTAGTPQGVSAFDPLSRDYYLYVWYVSGETKLHAVNVRTGAVTASSAVTAVSTAVESGRR